MSSTTPPAQPRPPSKTTYISSYKNKGYHPFSYLNQKRDLQGPKGKAVVKTMDPQMDTENSILVSKVPTTTTTSTTRHHVRFSGFLVEQGRCMANL